MKKLLLLSLLVLLGCSKEDNSALIDSYTSQISSLNAQISQLNTQIAQSQSQITSLQSQVNSISGLEATIDNLNSQITDYQSQISYLQAEVNSLNSQVANNSSLQATIDSLNAQIASKNELIASLQAQIDSLGSSTSTTTDDWPDYAAQGHSMSAIGVWTLYSTRNNPIPQSRQFEIKIYPDSNNPNKLNNTTSPQTGRVDFNGTTGLGFNYNYGTYNGSTISVNTSGSGGNGILRFDSTDIPGIDTNAFYGGKYFYATYYFATDSEAEKIVINLNVSTVDQSIYPDTLISAVFYRTK